MSITLSKTQPDNKLLASQIQNHKKYEINICKKSELREQFVRRMKTSNWHYKFDAKGRRPKEKIFRFQRKICSLSLPKETKTLNMNLKWLFMQHKDVTRRCFTEMIDILKGLSTLQSLNIDLSRSYGADDLGLLILGKGLKRLPSLKSIAFDFTDCEDISAQGFSDLFQGLRQLPSLENLKLTLDECRGFSDQALSALSKSLKTMTSLKSFILKITGQSDIHEEGFEDLIKALPKLQSLQILHLDFKENRDIWSDSYEFLIEALRKLPSLHTLNIGFNHFRFMPGTEGIVPFIEAIPTLTTLSNLNLAFNGSQLRDGKRSKLSESLKKVPSFTHIHIRYSEYGEVVKTSQEMFKFDFLENITFDLDDKASDEGMEALGKYLEKCASLRNLTMDIGNTYHLTNIGLQPLWNGLKLCNRLQTLNLRFFHCWEISVDGFTDLAECLKNLTSLQNITLEVDDCFKLDEESISTIFDHLKALSLFQRLNLSLKPSLWDGHDRQQRENPIISIIKGFAV